MQMREQPGADPAVDQPPEREREQRVEQREDGAVEQAQLGIADREVGLDLRGEDREDLPVEQAHRLRRRHQEQRIPAVQRPA